ncbi:MAG: NUDIX hydrolase [Minisyncoccales bacterium]|jgi:8-oxo-dGTP diphosphatase
MLYSIVLTIVVQDNKILLLKRKKGDFINLLAIPGGKIEENEHVKDAAKRELEEESGIESDFKEYLGCVSEILIEKNAIKANFILHLCELIPKTKNISNDVEGKMEWYNLNSLDKIKEQIIPSDYEMIKNFVLNKNKKYFDCIEEKIGDKYYIRKFV